MSEKNKKPAIDAAADYLANRPRTVEEVRTKLKDKGYEQEEIESAIANLVEFKYLDDYSYCKMYFEYGYTRHRGGKRLIRELVEKGVNEQQAKTALEDYVYEMQVDEYKDALEIARREAEDKIIDEKLIARIGRKLDSRGFKMDDIYKVMSEVRRWKDTEEQ